MVRVTVLIVAHGLVGCTSQSVYEGLKVHRRSECLKAQPARVDECMEAVDTPYEQYRREREDGLDREPSTSSTNGRQVTTVRIAASAPADGLYFTGTPWTELLTTADRANGTTEIDRTGPGHHEPR